MKRQEGSKKRVLLLAIIIVLLTFSVFRYYYFAKHGEEFIPSMIKRVIRPPEENQETAKEVKKLTVNPNYDGENKEFIYDISTDDTNAVARIHQTITYKYYDEKGNSIAIIETQSFNTHGEVLFSGYKRGNSKMADTTVLRQEIDISYRYETDIIYRDCTLISYTETDSQTSSDSSEINRTLP